MICGVCKQAEYFLKCDGCILAVCDGCLKCGLFDTGCGCIQSLYPCPTCFGDPGVNCG